VIGSARRGSLGIDHTLMLLHFTWPIVVAGASNQKARIRAQKAPVFSPAGSGNEKQTPKGSLVIQRTK
jgi:hypothetical protein